MKIELTVIEDLGIKLYGKLPPVMAEMVANAWDADASSVEITFDEGHIDSSSKIVIKDNGRGMSYDEINAKYLTVGRKKRDVEGTDKTHRGRMVMGRKGIGKLSIFGVATIAEIATVMNGKKSIFQMNVNDMLEEARKTNTYNPYTIMVGESTDDKSGTVITLIGLKRKTRMDTQSIRRGIAKHFSVIGDGFRVSVNGQEVLPSDNISESEWEHKWEINECVDENRPGWHVSGWIGATRKPLVEEERGITITARGKLIQNATFFGVKSGGRYSYSYLVGEIAAEFFDDTNDLISTNRQSLAWETPEGEALMLWGSKKIVEISDELVLRRQTSHEKAMAEDPEIRDWLDSLEEPAKRRAHKIIRVVSSMEGDDNDKRKELVQYARASFEQSVFLEMVNEMDEHPEPAMLLDMFREWNVVEAREMERIVKGRLETIRQLVNHVRHGAKEVPTLHDYFSEWPWMLDPTWTQWQHEVHFSELLRKHFPDKRLNEANRRIDFVSIGVGDTVNVIELKRPKYSVKSADFIQLAKYVGFIKRHIGNAPGRKYSSVTGYLIVGTRSKEPETQELTEMGERSRYYVKTYEDLIHVANQLHLEFQQKLNEFKKKKR